MFSVEVADGREKNLTDINHLLSECGYGLYIYGGGVYARILRQYLYDHGVCEKVCFVIDDEYATVGTNTIPLSEFIKTHSKRSVLVLGIYDHEVIERFKTRYKEMIPHMYEFHLTVVLGRYLEWKKDFVYSRMEKFEQTYSMFSDDLSRLTMNLYLEAAVGGDFSKLYDKCHVNCAYFNEVTEELGIDVFIDCGAFDGDSIHDFVKMFPDHKDIIAFEPDPANVEKIKQREEKEGILSLHIIPCGVHSKTGFLYFESEGKSSSHLSNTGNTKIRAMRLDDILDASSGFGPGYFDGRRIILKMDIEGSEPEALKGAESLIRWYRPCLAICVYHREDDLITIPGYIDSLSGGEYEYYLRFHGPDLSELVFYAIPRSYRQRIQERETQ